MNAPDIDPVLPGAELVRRGLADLQRGDMTEASLLMLIAAPRLRALGLHVPETQWPRPREHLLYEKLEERLGAGAHSQYNSLIRRVVSFARALEREAAQRRCV